MTLSFKCWRFDHKLDVPGQSRSPPCKTRPAHCPNMQTHVLSLIVITFLLSSFSCSTVSARFWSLQSIVSCSVCSCVYARQKLVLSKKNTVHVSMVYCSFSLSFFSTYRAGILRSQWKLPGLWPGACGKSPAFCRQQPLQPRWDQRRNKALAWEKWEAKQLYNAINNELFNMLKKKEKT
jgi:hypothetical protein